MNVHIFICTLYTQIHICMFYLESCLLKKSRGRKARNIFALKTLFFRERANAAEIWMSQQTKRDVPESEAEVGITLAPEECEVWLQLATWLHIYVPYILYR